MVDKQTGIFSALLFFGIAALFFPATALENAVANAQEEEYSRDYIEEEARDGYYTIDNEESYYSYEDNKKKDPIVVIKKKLFMCNNVETTGFFFDCFTQFENAAGPNSGEYTPCTEDLCPGIDESEFAVQIFKDVATVSDLNPQGTLVNLDKFHYSVTENRLNDLITDESTLCFPTGFRHFLFYEKETEDNFVQFNICVNYVGDCDGTIYPGQIKTCTVENYIVAGVIRELQTGNAIDSAITGTTTLNTTTNPTIQSSNIAGVPNSVPLNSLPSGLVTN
ncbi:MAG TPA: hypothetical protein VLA74_13775 [Nitrososphaeraceae archaeon]|nr:hypothetical protein [Nitrososphaeraceae archaeon]